MKAPLHRRPAALHLPNPLHRDPISHPVLKAVPTLGASGGTEPKTRARTIGISDRLSSPQLAPDFASLKPLRKTPFEMYSPPSADFA